MEAEIQARIMQRKRANELSEQRYFEDQAWQKTLVSRELISGSLDSTATKANASGAAMMYETNMITAGIGMGVF